MKRWLFGLIGAVALAALAWGIFLRPAGESLVNLPPTATGPWVAFGDSLTEGYGAEPGQDYPSQLSGRLGIPITNLGRSGETSGDGRARVDEIASLRPRVVLLCFGGNDELRRLPRSEMLSNLSAIIDRLQMEGTFVVLMGIRSASVRDRNVEGFRRLAREKGVLHVSDLMDGVMFHQELMSDAVHPNERGYAQIAGRLEAELSPWMAQLR